MHYCSSRHDLYQICAHHRAIEGRYSKGGGGGAPGLAFSWGHTISCVHLLHNAPPL